jgi:CheY-like chemotaxis protein
MINVRRMDRQSCVLVIEDDPDLRESLVEMLRHHGHRVCEASNGRVALDLLHRNPPPDVIVLDLMMPVMDGIEFLRRARSEAALRELPILVLTASNLPKPAGATDALRKPADLDRMLAEVQRYCAHPGTRRRRPG